MVSGFPALSIYIMCNIKEDLFFKHGGRREHREHRGRMFIIYVFFCLLFLWKVRIKRFSFVFFGFRHVFLIGRFAARL